MQEKDFVPRKDGDPGVIKSLQRVSEIFTRVTVEERLRGKLNLAQLLHYNSLRVLSVFGERGLGRAYLEEQEEQMEIRQMLKQNK